MRNHVRFSSAQFAPRKPEEDQVNSGRYGEELANWLRQKLGESGVSTRELIGREIGEDWGWCFLVQDWKDAHWVNCGNVDGSENDWLVWAAPALGCLGLLFRRGRVGTPATLDLCRRIDAVLRSDPGISGIEWCRLNRHWREEDHGAHPDGP